jgi:hypothetical protein
MISIANCVRGSALLFLLLATIGGGTASSADAQVPAKGAGFGDKLIFQSMDGIDYSVSADKQAFTILFTSALEAEVGSPPTPTSPDPPVGTQAFAVVIPVSGQNIDTNFVVTAVVIVNEGAEAALVLAVNDKTTVMRFPPGTDKEVLVQLKYRAKTASDIRLTLFLLAERDQAHPKAGATVHVSAIDTDLALAKQRLKKQ